VAVQALGVQAQAVTAADSERPVAVQGGSAGIEIRHGITLPRWVRGRGGPPDAGGGATRYAGRYPGGGGFFPTGAGGAGWGGSYLPNCRLPTGPGSRSNGTKKTPALSPSKQV